MRGGRRREEEGGGRKKAGMKYGCSMKREPRPQRRDREMKLKRQRRDRDSLVERVATRQSRRGAAAHSRLAHGGQPDDLELLGGMKMIALEEGLTLKGQRLLIL